MNKTSLTLEANSEGYSEPCQTSKMDVFAKIVNGFSSLTIFAESSVLDVWQESEFASEASKNLWKSSTSAVWQGFEFTFVLIILAKQFPNCLLNLINIFHHISVLYTVKSTWPYVQHIWLIMKILIGFRKESIDLLVLANCLVKLLETKHVWNKGSLNGLRFQRNHTYVCVSGGKRC